VRLRRSRFARLAEAQLDVFARDHRDALDEVDRRLDAYRGSDRADAEELYGDYVDAVDTAADILAEMRDHYARTVDDRDAYVRAFTRAAASRFPELARGLDGG